VVRIELHEVSPEVEPRAQPAGLALGALRDVGCVGVDERRLPLEIRVDQPDEAEPDPQDLDPSDHAAV
jgi:hypothetical protein